MDIIKIIIIIIMGVCILSLFYLGYSFNRNFKVYYFLKGLLDKINRSDILLGTQQLKVIESLSYEKILYSFKPLKYKYWLTPEQIKLFNIEEEK